MVLEADKIKAIENSTVLLNVAVIPSAETAGEIEALSEELSNRGALFKIDGRTKHAHLTLYMARFSADRISDVKNRLGRTVDELEPVSMNHTGYFVTNGRYYEASYERNDELMRMHEAVIGALSDARYSPGAPVVESYFGDYNDQQRKNAEELGYDLAGELYRPHITITRFGVLPEIADLPRSGRDLSFAASRLGLFVADENGAATHLISVFDLTM